MIWEGYALLAKPAALSLADWNTVLQALARLLGKADDAGNPRQRLHWRRSLDGTKVIVQATFDAADLDRTDLARLPRYISQALAGKYSPTQVRAALAGNVTVFGQADDWQASAEIARAYIGANLAEWERAGGEA